MPTTLRADRMLRVRRVASALTGRRADPAAVVARLGAVQAQDLHAGRWALGARTGAAVATVDATLDAGGIVRAYPMRATLHWVVPADLRWMLSITGPRMLASATKQRADRGIDDAVLATAIDVATTALVGGRRLDRAEYFAALEAAGIDPAGGRGYLLIVLMSAMGIVCWGPTTASGQALVLLDEWAPTSSAPPERDEVLARFAIRYAAGHGPVTDRDLAWWAGITLGDARRGIAAAGDALDAVRFDDRDHVVAAGALEQRAVVPRLALLAAFDEYVLGYADRSLQLPPEHERRVFPGANGMFLPALTVDGIAAGVWRRTLTTRRVRVDVTPFAPLSAELLADLVSAARGYADFLGRELDLSVDGAPHPLDTA